MKKFGLFIAANALLFGCFPAAPLPVSPTPQQSGSVPQAASSNRPNNPQPSASASAPVSVPSSIALVTPTPSPSPTSIQQGDNTPIHTGSGSSGGGSSIGSGSSGGEGSIPRPTPLPIPTPTAPPDNIPVIQDLRLPDGPSVLGKGAPGAIRSDYNGLDIVVQAIGYFFDPSPSEVSVVLDKAIAFSLVNTSNYVLTFKLNTKNIPDLYLEGPHAIKIKVGESEIQSVLQVGSPLSEASLFPVIRALELKGDITSGHYLEIRGNNLMLSPQFSHVKIDDTVILVDSSAMADETTILTVKLPTDFDPNTSHQMTYSTPFGSAIQNF